MLFDRIPAWSQASRYNFFKLRNRVKLFSFIPPNSNKHRRASNIIANIGRRGFVPGLLALNVFGLFSIGNSSNTTSSNSDPNSKEGLAHNHKHPIDIGIYCLAKQNIAMYGNITKSGIHPESTAAKMTTSVAPCDCGEDSFALAFRKIVEDEEATKENRHHDDQNRSREIILMAVADGVGSWRKKGIDPSWFSRGLCAYLKEAFMKFPFKPQDSKNNSISVDPQDLQAMIKRAFANLIIDAEQEVGKHPYGSSTLVSAILDPSRRKLVVANIGDSGLMVLRDNVVFRTECQQRHFNAPYQMYYGPHRIKDVSDEAQLASVSIHPGDLIILASDGVYDNVSQADIVQLRYEYPKVTAHEFAELVATKAKMHSRDPNLASPFAKEAAKHGLNHQGGKEDDITVIVCIV